MAKKSKAKKKTVKKTAKKRGVKVPTPKKKTKKGTKKKAGRTTIRLRIPVLTVRVADLAEQHGVRPEALLRFPDLLSSLGDDAQRVTHAVAHRAAIYNQQQFDALCARYGANRKRAAEERTTTDEKAPALDEEET